MKHFEETVIIAVAVMISTAAAAIAIIDWLGHGNQQQIQIEGAQIVELVTPPVTGLIAILAIYARRRNDVE